MPPGNIQLQLQAVLDPDQKQPSLADQFAAHVQAVYAFQDLQDWLTKLKREDH